MRHYTRRDFGRLTGLGVLGAALPLCGQEPTEGASTRLYVGTYTEGRSVGIYQLSLNLETGSLTQEGEATPSVNPSYLTIHPNGRFLYAVNEVTELDGKPGGGLSAFAIDPDSGDLEPINQASTHGAWPCYVAVEPSGRCALVANYLGGSCSQQTSGRID